MKNKYKILLIGAGQLGSRHLQAIAKIDNPLEIDVVDPSNASLDLCKKRFEDCVGKKSIHNISFNNTMSCISDRYEVCVVATSSDVRADVTRSLLSKSKVSNIVFEKTLFQKESDYEEIGDLLDEKNVKAWVNCPRRLYSIYNLLKGVVTKIDYPIHLAVLGGEWGLASNAIHFLDLIAYLTGDQSYKISMENLDKELLKSKRPGYIELSGIISGMFSSGSTFSLQSLRGSEASHCISLVLKNNVLVIDEINGRISFEKKDITSDIVKDKFSIPYQSDLTNKVILDIVEKQMCNLTPFSDSCLIHLPFIRGLLSYCNNLTNNTSDKCSVT